VGSEMCIRDRVNISTYCINLLILKYICLFLRFSCFICVDTTISVVTRIPWAKGLRDLQAWEGTKRLGLDG
jgi:hypothetical protein